MTTISSKDLNRLLNTLPQELFDEIYDLTFTADPIPNICPISKDWQPTHLLHVDRVSRAQFARTYFSTTIFTISLGRKQFTAYCTLRTWLGALPEEHLALIRSVEIISDRKKDFVRNLRGGADWKLVNHGREERGEDEIAGKMELKKQEGEI